MIRKIEPAKQASGAFVVADIENWPTGEVIAIDTAWREPAGIEHFLCHSWAEWWAWLRSRAKDDKRFRCIYAHNGGGWDWLSLAHWLLTDGKGERETLTAACSGSKMVTMGVTVEKGFTIVFADSFQLLRSSLAKLAAVFLGGGKINLEGALPHEIWQTDRPRFYEYLNGDTTSLLLILERALELIREKVAKIDCFGYTVASTALKVFKTIGIDEPIFTPWQPDLREFLRWGYKGGRVECFEPGIYDRVTVYDINSLYPYAMLTTDVPTSHRGFWADPGRGWKAFDLSRPGVFEIEWTQTRRDLLPILCIDGAGQYKGRGVFFTPELILLKELDPKCPITLHRGFVFFDKARVFKRYVDSLYSLRLSDPGGALSELCKYLLNNLYGKMGQHPEREKIVCVTSFAELHKAVLAGAEYRPICEGLGVFGLTEERDCPFEHVGIAGTITSAARVALYRGFLASTGRVVYCDTDSVHTTGALPAALVGSEIGRYKIECVGAGAYAGKKLYALDPAVAPEKVRAKGVSVGGRNGAAFGYADIVAICRGQSRRCEFQKPATPLEVFSGAKTPCQFRARARRLRMTAGQPPSPRSKRPRK